MVMGCTASGSSISIPMLGLDLLVVLESTAAETRSERRSITSWTQRARVALAWFSILPIKNERPDLDWSFELPVSPFTICWTGTMLYQYIQLLVCNASGKTWAILQHTNRYRKGRHQELKAVPNHAPFQWKNGNFAQGYSTMERVPSPAGHCGIEAASTH